MKSILFGCSVLFILSFNCFGQEGSFTCNHADPNTESLKQIQSLLAHSQKSTDLKIIPVVFHVLHQYGSENIPDAQILDAMNYLNLHFQKLNPDTIDVVSPFDTIIGKVNFEFRLATIDPNGNPTTGIDRIFTPLTNLADDHSKLNSWNPKSYLNIWIVKTLKASGISGYTYNPLQLDTDDCKDGIMMLNDYIGSIGTSSSVKRFFLAHEMGHYFGLYHLFNGNGTVGTSDCDYSDGIYDTPKQVAAYTCSLPANSCNDLLDPESFNYWGFDVQDMTQNFMNTTYCMSMFSKAQVDLMRSVVESPLYGRDQLWTNANLIATGTGPGSAPLSLTLPSSDFSIQTGINPNFLSTLACIGDSVKVFNASGQLNAISYQWSFPGGSPSNSSLPNPKVAYMNPGYYDISLTTTNTNGSTTTTKSSVVYVSGSWAEFTGPTVQNFDLSGDFWQSQNTSGDNGYFQRIGTSGMQNTGCFLLGNHYDPDTTNACYEMSENQINRSKDNLISPAFDLSTTSTVTVSFDYAFGCAAVPDSATEVLKVYYSRDCGETWIQKKVILDTSLVTAFAPQSANFIPAQNQWKHVSFPFTSTANDTRTRFKFEFVASNYSNNLYIDNFVIDGVLGISDNALSTINVFPNPSKKGGAITISGLNVSASNLTISDLQGKQVYQKELLTNSSESEIQLDANLRSGCYLVEVTQNNSRFLTRLIIE